MVFFNRGAEPLAFDPLHKADRKKNAHMLILVAYISMMSYINDLVERHQHDARPTLVVTG